MSARSWRDTNLGSMRRAALWLVQVVGEGNAFTKSQLREAFPDVAQIDRRMRDLRKFGWKIDTNREDVSLDPHEQRFTQRGTAVWEEGKTRTGESSAITPSQRYEVLKRDGHKCRSCGITPGETYKGTEVTAQLDVARRPVLLPGGQRKTQLVIECNRCRVGNRDLVVELGEVLARVGKLPTIEKKLLATWIAQDARTFSEVEQVWAAYRTLPADAREEVRASLS